MAIGKGARKIEAYLNQYDINLSLKQFDKSTRTAEDAANAIGCQVKEIVKSLILCTKSSQAPVLVLASGESRVDFQIVEQQLADKGYRAFQQEGLELASAAFVKQKTGFPVGGVPPFGHNESMMTVMDDVLLQQDTLWAAAGDPRTVFNVLPHQLMEITGAI